MKTIILPGYSPSNKDWAESIKDYLENEGIETVVHVWEHWATGGEMRVSKEQERILKLVDDETVNIITKSVGTRIACTLLPKIAKQVNKLILCGIPTKGKSLTAQKNYAPLTHFPAQNILVFQNTKDPLASYGETVSFVKSINSEIVVKEMPRTDHHYPYSFEFASFLRS